MWGAELVDAAALLVVIVRRSALSGGQCRRRCPSMFGGLSLPAFSRRPRLRLHQCVGNGPSISIKGASGQQFTDTSCSTLVSVSAYVTDTCISLGSESFKIVCTDSGIVQMDFSDTQCASSSSNTTVESGAPNTCIPSQFGSGSSSRYSCVASALSHSLIASLLLLLVLCWFF